MASIYAKYTKSPLKWQHLIPLCYIALTFNFSSCSKAESLEVEKAGHLHVNESAISGIKKLIEEGQSINGNMNKETKVIYSEKELIKAQHPEHHNGNRIINYASLFLKSANDLKQKLRYEDAFNHYQRAEEIDPSNFEAIWNISLMYSELGEKLHGPRQMDYYQNAKYYANKAILLKPEHPEANFVMAIACGRLATTSRLRERMQYTKKVKSHLDATLDADPSHHMAWFNLGIWHYEISNMSQVELTIARVVLGNEIKEASFEKAALAFKNAVKHFPNAVSYNYHLGKTLLLMNEVGKAKKYLNKAAKLPAVMRNDEMYKHLARETLRRHG